MKVTIVPIVIGALGTITKWLLKDLEDLEVGGRVETIQTTASLKRPESWDESWRLEETCCPSDSSEKPSAKTDVKNSQGVKKRKKERRLITAANDNCIGNINIDRKTTKARKQKWEEKELYRYFKRQTGEIKHEKTSQQKGNPMDPPNPGQKTRLSKMDHPVQARKADLAKRNF